MKKLILLVFAVTACACATVETYESYASQSASPTFWTGSLFSDLSVGAELVEIAYEPPAAAVEKFSSKGIDATYFSPRYRLFFHYPEAFILSKKESNEIVVLFVGTNSGGDWLQNVKAGNYCDVPVNGTYFIPYGHAGFRRGMFNLIHNGFFTTTLSNHVEKYRVKNTSGSKIRVAVMGHSQGAGIAQIAAPTIDGTKYKNLVKSASDSWEYEVDRVYAYAPPYALATTTPDNRCGNRDWEYMNTTYGENTYMIIHDADFVTTVYNAISTGHKIPLRHYGHYIRVTRDGEVMKEATDWGYQTVDGDQPHLITRYRISLENASNRRMQSDVDNPRR